MRAPVIFYTFSNHSKVNLAQYQNIKISQLSWMRWVSDAISQLEAEPLEGQVLESLPNPDTRTLAKRKHEDCLAAHDRFTLDLQILRRAK